VSVFQDTTLLRSSTEDLPRRLRSVHLPRYTQLDNSWRWSSQDLPIIVEVVESADRIEQILPRLDEMVEGGLITLEKVRVILYRAAKK
jgi:Uncharacterized ACR, COG1993